MTLIIDGYNLLNAAGIFAPGAGPSTLERSRRALLDFLADNVAPAEATRTTIVFDAKHAPPGLPRTTNHRGLSVRFAARHEEADDLIEELIRADSAPRRLIVVSSDHRLQRAARRRKAVATDSDVWFRQIVAESHEREDARPDHSESRTQAPPSADEVDAWLRRFGDVDINALERADSTEKGTEEAPRTKLKDSEDVSELDEFADPFPPGYGEDVLSEEG